MTDPNQYKHGTWNVACDRCGFKFKATQIRREWNGLRVCDGIGKTKCFEPRQPQDFVRGKRDRQTVPWTRPETDLDVSVGSGNEITVNDL